MKNETMLADIAKYAQRHEHLIGRVRCFSDRKTDTIKIYLDDVEMNPALFKEIKRVVKSVFKEEARQIREEIDRICKEEYGGYE